MRVGIDIYEIKEFESSVRRSGDEFLSKIFTPKELENKDTQHLCGIFCAKEAAVKAGIIGVGEWLKIEIHKEESSRPRLLWASGKIIQNVDVSISHTQNVAAAIVIAS